MANSDRPTHETHSIAVGTLSCGQPADVVVHRLVGAQPGPTLGLIGGLHGDEPFSVELVRRVLDALEELPLRGTVTAVPCANPLAFLSLTRNTPVDMLDLNRVFPGDPDGMFSHQLAHVIYGVFVEECEFFIDFHSGGIFPTVDYVFAQRDEDFARSIGSKIVYSGKPHAGSVSDCLGQAGLHTTVVEVGGGPVDEALYVQRAVAGVRNTLHAIGMLTGPGESRDDQVLVHELRILRPHHGGLLISNLCSRDLGEVVVEGHELGRILHAQTLQELEVLKAPFGRSILILARAGSSPIGIGDFAYIVGDAA